MLTNIDFKRFFQMPFSWWILVPIVAVRPVAMLIEDLLNVLLIYLSENSLENEPNAALMADAFRDFGQSPSMWMWMGVTAVIGIVFLKAYEWMIIRKTMVQSAALTDFKDNKTWLPNNAADFKTIALLMLKFVGVVCVNLLVISVMICAVALPIVLMSLFYEISFIRPLVIFIQVVVGISAFFVGIVALMLYGQAAFYSFVKTWEIRSYLRFPTLYRLSRRQFKPLLIICGLNLLLSQVWTVAGELIIEVLPVELWTFIGSFFFVYLMTLMAAVRGKCFFWLDQKENPPKRRASQKK